MNPITPRELFCSRLKGLDTSKIFHTITVYHRLVDEYEDYEDLGLYNLRSRKKEGMYVYFDIWLTEKGRTLLEFSKL